MNTNTNRFFKLFQTGIISFKNLKKAEDLSLNLDLYSNDLKLILSLIKDSLSGKFELSKKELSVFIGAVIYFITPLDAIPDFIPVTGWLDDGAVIAYVIKNSLHTLNRYKENLKELS